MLGETIPKPTKVICIHIEKRLKPCVYITALYNSVGYVEGAWVVVVVGGCSGMFRMLCNHDDIDDHFATELNKCCGTTIY